MYGFSCACFRRFLDKKVLKVNRIAMALSHANVDIFRCRARHVGTFPGQTRSVLWPQHASMSVIAAIERASYGL